MTVQELIDEFNYIDKDKEIRISFPVIKTSSMTTHFASFKFNLKRDDDSGVVEIIVDY